MALINASLSFFRAQFRTEKYNYHQRITSAVTSHTAETL